MDEPFAALDEITRIKLNDDLLELFARQGLTVIFVTHSVYESVYLSSRIVVMSSRPGRVSADSRSTRPTRATRNSAPRALQRASAASCRRPCAAPWPPTIPADPDCPCSATWSPPASAPRSRATAMRWRFQRPRAWLLVCSGQLGLAPTARCPKSPRSRPSLLRGDRRLPCRGRHELRRHRAPQRLRHRPGRTWRPTWRCATATSGRRRRPPP